MPSIKAADFAQKGKELLDLANRQEIPYVKGCSSEKGMDCQGLIEYLMRQCGLSRNWSGSNDMWRNALKWAGTPEGCVEKFGAVPSGAGIFIVENDGGEPDEYKRTDEKLFGGSKGNASHVGLYLGKSSVVNASGSRGYVCESTKFNGKKAVPNGGWNMVGFWSDVDYGEQIEALIGGSLNDSADAGEEQGASQSVSGWNPKYTNIMVKKGCLGGAVRELQHGLALLDYDLAEDGDFGAITDNAVRHFQREHGLEEDGCVGKMTWAALIDAVEVALHG